MSDVPAESQASATELPAAAPDPFEELLARGVKGWDPAEVAYIASLRARARAERAELRVALLEATFDAERGRIARHLDDPAFDEATRDELRAAFLRGDLVEVELLASTRPRHRVRSTLRDEFLERVRARADALGIGLDARGSGVADALMSASAVEARAAAIAAEARALDLESIGPYNAWAVALQVLGRLDDVAPSYLASWVAFLEDVASLELEEPTPAKPARGKPSSGGGARRAGKAKPSAKRARGRRAVLAVRPSDPSRGAVSRRAGHRP